LEEEKKEVVQAVAHQASATYATPPTPQKPPASPKPPRAHGFEAFWTEYPARGGRKRFKAKALEVWISKGLADIAEEVVEGVKVDKAYRLDLERKAEFSPAWADAPRYLRDRGWESEGAPEGDPSRERVIPTRDELIEKARKDGDTDMLRRLEAE